jgi:hypothetical protein
MKIKGNAVNDPVKRVVNVTLEFKPDPSQQKPAGAPTP